MPVHTPPVTFPQSLIPRTKVNYFSVRIICPLNACAALHNTFTTSDTTNFDNGGIVLTPPRLRTNGLIRRTLSGSRSWEWAESSEAIYTSIRQQGFDLAFIHIQEPLKGVGREMAAMSNQHIHTDF